METIQTTLEPQRRPISCSTPTNKEDWVTVGGPTSDCRFLFPAGARGNDISPSTTKE